MRTLPPHVPGTAEAWLRTVVPSLTPGSAAPGAVVVAALCVAAIGDIVFHDGVGPLGAAVFVAALATAVLATRSLSTPQPIALLATAVALTAIFVVRAGPAVALSAVAAITVCMTAAVISHGSGDIFDLSWTNLLQRSAVGAANIVLAPWWLLIGIVARLPGARTLPRGVVRGTLLSVPLIGVLAVLLMSADPVFAGLFQLQIDTQAIVVHVVLICWGATAAAMLLRAIRSGAVPAEEGAIATPVGAAETVVILSLVTVLFSVFVATQGAAALGAGRDTLVRQGITYADYARSGYFQLLWVVGIISCVLPCLEPVGRAATSKVRLRIRILSVVVIALTLVIAGVAAHRLALYDDAYGLTVLRVSSAAAGLWMAVVLVLLGAWVGGVLPRRRWFPGALVVSVVIGATAFGILDPDRYVATYDIDHAAQAHLDIPYLASLSDDAVPALVASAPRLDARDRAELFDRLCRRPRPPGSWAQWNVASADAERGLVTMCPHR